MEELIINLFDQAWSLVDPFLVAGLVDAHLIYLGNRFAAARLKLSDRWRDRLNCDHWLLLLLLLNAFRPNEAKQSFEQGRLVLLPEAWQADFDSRNFAFLLGQRTYSSSLALTFFQVITHGERSTCQERFWSICWYAAQGPLLRRLILRALLVVLL